MDAGEEDFCIPALALAALQRDPKASPPDLEVDGLVVLADEVDAMADVNEGVDDKLGLPVVAGWFAWAETEVK